LSEHKHSLELITESAKFDYQKKLADFNLFAAKKHDNVTKLYALLVEAKGAVATFTSVIQNYNSGEDWNTVDFTAFLEKCTISAGQREDYLTRWAANPKSIKEEIIELQQLQRDATANNAIINCNNQSIYTQIYVSASVNEDVHQFILKLWELYFNGRAQILHIKQGEYRDTLNLYETYKTLNAETEQLMNSLVFSIRKELSE